MRMTYRLKKCLLAVLSAILIVSSCLSFGFSALFSGNGLLHTLAEREHLGNNRFNSDFDNKADMLADGNDVQRQIIEEGTILLKNEDDALPLSEGAKISMFGYGSIYPGYTCATTLKSALIAEGFDLNPALTNFYTNQTSTRSTINGNTTIYGYATGEKPVSDLVAAGVESTYSNYNDAAIVVISREVGEGHDNPRTMMWNGSSITSYSEGNMSPVAGARSMDDHYMQLDQNETDLLAHVCDNFSKVIVLINAGSEIETGFLDDPGHYAYHEEIKAALWIGNYGWGALTSHRRLGAILKGEVSPSGKTTDTWSRDYKLDPVWQNWGNNLIKDGNKYTNARFASSSDYVNRYVIYKEGIYVGYRYWETRGYDMGADPFNSANGSENYVHNTTTTSWDNWYNAHVVYPFGYGLSYTTFDWEVVDTLPAENASLSSDGEIKITVKVTNTGNYAGKDVVQLYYTAPYEAGGIEKAHVVLGAFEKTKTLEPNESQQLTLTLKTRDMASYDWNDANSNGFKGYELESGSYKVKLMRNAHEEVASVHYNVANDVRYETDEATGEKIENRFDSVSNYLLNDVKVDNGNYYLSRRDWEGTFPKMSVGEEAPQWVIDELTEWEVDGNGVSRRDPEKDNDQPYYSAEKPTTGAKNGLVLDDMYGLDYDDPRWDLFLDQLTEENLLKMATTGSYWTGIDIPELGVQRLDSEDCPIEFHPVGSSPNKGGTYNNYGGESLLAATWNKELAYRKGRSMGNNGLWGNGQANSRIGVWYAPAVNIHRSPFGGRNYEYYSEDGYLTGAMAANVVKGANSVGLLTTVKHFALNEQETNRLGVMTWANEQSMRELYFKPFELCVKEGKTKGIMSSLNRIGATWTGGARNLLTEILRDEWGFEGFVVTDSYMGDNSNLSNADQMIRAGGDLSLGSATLKYNANSATTYSLLRQASKNILFALADSMALNFDEYPVEPPAFSEFETQKLSVGVVGATYRASVATAVLNADAFPNADPSEIVYSLAEGSNDLPSGLSLASDGMITGKPEAECVNYSVTIQATYQSYSTTAQIVFNIIGTDGAIVYNPVSEAVKTGKIGEKYFASVAEAQIYMPDATPEEIEAMPPVVYTLGNGSLLPSGLTLSSDGTISGTPDKGCLNYRFTVVASAKGFYAVEVEYEVSIVADLVFSGDQLSTGRYGVSYFDRVMLAKCDYPVTYRLKDGASLPKGLTLTESGYIVGTPKETVTDYVFVVQAISDFSLVAEAEYYIDIGLYYGSVRLEKGKVGEEYYMLVDAAAGAGDIVYTVTKGSLPNGVTLSEYGELNGKPTEAGTFVFTVSASSDGKLNDERTLTLIVTGDENTQGGDGLTIIALILQICTLIVGVGILVLLVMLYVRGGSGGKGGGGKGGGSARPPQAPGMPESKMPSGEEKSAMPAVVREEKKSDDPSSRAAATDAVKAERKGADSDLFPKAESGRPSGGVKVRNYTKAMTVWSCITAGVLLIVFVATMVLTQNAFLYNTVCSVLGGSDRYLKSGNPEDYQYYTADYASKSEALTAANALNEEICEEGIVLLKNEDDVLPLSGKRITVFGKNSVNMVLGGSGSNAGASSAVEVNLNETLRTAGFECNNVIENYYKGNSSGDKRPENPSIGSILTGFPTAESKLPYPQSVKDSYKNYSDAALVVISRVCGEGYDLPRTMAWDGSSYTNGKRTQVIPGARSMDDHYLQLDQNETDMIREACDNFNTVIVIINSASPMELGFLDDPDHYAYHSNLKGALLIGAPGVTGVNALGRILNGSVNPSGRTVDTFARDFRNDPTWYNFGDNRVSKNNTYKYDGKETNTYFVEYREGIYVGYRYWETRGYTAGGTWYEDNVVYPFGYGKSYTQFTYSATPSVANGSVLSRDGKLSFEVDVTNIGTQYDGKEVLQLYYTAEYKGGIEKAHVVLGDYVKTGLLKKNNGSGKVTLEIDVRDMASYDYDDANGNKFKGYELEAGVYTLYITTDSHGWADADAIKFTYTVPSGGFRYETEENGTTITNLFDDVSSGIVSENYLSRKNDFANFSNLEGAFSDANRSRSREYIESLSYTLKDNASDPWYANEMPKQSKTEISAADTKVKLYDVIGKDYKDVAWDALLDQLTVNQMVSLISTGNFRTLAMENIDKPLTTDCDGPMGFSLFMGDSSVYDTCYYACETVLAQTFNKDLAYALGKMIGNEGVIGNEKGDGSPYSGWYAPAVNIHRSQFGGRNFEYYSEDPVLSAKMATGVVKGANEKGLYTFVKHFALNEQETNRDTTGLVTWANEQCMRELYFKPFRECVVEGKTTAMMSSFNRIGKTWAGGNYNLLTKLLRGEWGFNGTVITDYNLKTYMDADQMIRAGGDLNLSGGKSPTATTSATDVSCIRRAAKNVLYTVANSCAMNGHGNGVVWGYTIPTFVVWLIIINVLLVCGTATMILLTVLQKRKFKELKGEQQ